MIVMVLDPLSWTSAAIKRHWESCAGRVTGALCRDTSLQIAVSRPGILEHGAGGQFQRLLPFSGRGGNRRCVILTSYEYMAVQGIRAGEYYALVLFGAVGMSLMSSAVELVLIFIALEISSISTYILAGFRRRAAISS